jgi:hypothetical protein
MFPVKDILLVLGLTIGAVILINVGIILVFRKGGKRRDLPYKTLGKAINITRNPWRKETEQLDELSNLLDSIKEEKNKGEYN